MSDPKHYVEQPRTGTISDPPQVLRAELAALSVWLQSRAWDDEAGPYETALEASERLTSARLKFMASKVNASAGAGSPAREATNGRGARQKGQHMAQSKSGEKRAAALKGKATTKPTAKAKAKTKPAGK